MRFLLFFFLLSLFLFSCDSRKDKDIKEILAEQSQLTCDAFGCYGEYFGPEYSNGSDIAHQFPNLMADSVGVHLKRLYKQGKYHRVALDGIKMSTEGMGTGTVHYIVEIPFWRLEQKCLATTAFDHVGGWGHKPALKQRKAELSKELLFDDYLDVSKLKSTPEGLQEYWIQWRHKEVQAGCEK
jgi:hypothetical protein